MASIKKYFTSSTKEMPEVDSAAAKRSRSDGSSTGSMAGLHDAKKACEDLELEMPELPEVEFESDTPFWVPLMFKSMEAIMCQVAHVKKKVDGFSEFRDEIRAKFDELEKSVTFVASEFEEKKATISSLEDRVAKLEKKNEELLTSHNKLAARADNNEQHSRNECLLVHGVPEAPREDTDKLFVEVVSNNLGFTITSPDLKRSHRLGRERDDGKPRPIIARFARMDLRNKVYYHKKLLKGKKFLITENLTDRRLAAYNEAKTKYGVTNVWTQEGRIMAKNDTGKFPVKI